MLLTAYERTTLILKGASLLQQGLEGSTVDWDEWKAWALDHPSYEREAMAARRAVFSIAIDNFFGKAIMAYAADQHGSVA